MRNPNAWRWNLDPRDPQYMDPPTAEEQEAEDEMQEFFAEGKEQDHAEI